MHILLVEDEPHVRIALARPLVLLGHRVTEASTLREAHLALDHPPPDVAIVDINLPDGTGWAVLQGIRDRGYVDTRSIVISALPPNTDRIRQFAPFGMLLKPFPLESLKHLVSRAHDSLHHPKGEIDA